jgi:AcrR family transcriptional regulator
LARPRSFDEAHAVHAALQVFLAKGYDGASIADLTAAMGIKPASLYAAFGDKRSLFGRVMDAYALRRAPLIESALSAGSIETVVDRLLHTYADALTDGDFAPGCLYVQGALSCSDAASSVKEELASRRLAIEPELESRFKQAVDDRELRPSADCRALARYIATLLQGMAVQASGGATREELHALASVATDQFRNSLSVSVSC